MDTAKLNSSQDLVAFSAVISSTGTTFFATLSTYLDPLSISTTRGSQFDDFRVHNIEAIPHLSVMLEEVHILSTLESPYFIRINNCS